MFCYSLLPYVSAMYVFCSGTIECFLYLLLLQSAVDYYHVTFDIFDVPAIIL